MAFPWIFESNFEQGTNAEWDSESDTGSKLDFPHYSTLARAGGIGAATPYRGAYCMRVVMGDANAHQLVEGDIDIADTVTRWSSFYLYVGQDVVASADDTFNIYEVQGTADAVEGVVGLRITATTDAVEIGTGKVAPTVFADATLTKGQWYHVELRSVIQTGGTGTSTLFLDGAQVATVTTITNTAVLRGLLGTVGTLSTTTGTLLFDRFRFDDAQVYPELTQFPLTQLLTKDAHVFVGHGAIENISLLSGAGTDNVLSVYDTDTGNTNNAGKIVDELKNTANNAVVDSARSPFPVQRGAYIVMTGTNPRALVTIGRAQGYCSAGRIRQHGQNRKDAPQNI